MTTPIILSQFFYPKPGATAQLITDLSLELSRLNSNVRVITATPGDDLPGVTIKRLNLPSLGERSILSKSVSGILFTAYCLFYLLRQDLTQSRLLIVSNPPFIGIIGLILNALNGCRYTFLIQDLFPQSAFLTGIISHHNPLYRLCRLAMASICKNSENIIVLSDEMSRKAFSDFNLPVLPAVIPNWSVSNSLTIQDNDPYPYSSRWNLDRSFVIQYSGNQGRLHDLITLLEAARLLQHLNILFVFIGDGAKHMQVKQYRDKYELSNILIKPLQPLSRLSASLKACDMSVVSTIFGSHQIIAPSKLYGILSTGKPVLAITSPASYLAKEVFSSKFGICVAPGDVLELSSQLQHLYFHREELEAMGRNASHYYKQNFGLHKSAIAYNNILNPDKQT